MASLERHKPTRKIVAVFVQKLLAYSSVGLFHER
jgi:hypothetical protein